MQREHSAKEALSQIWDEDSGEEHPNVTVECAESDGWGDSSEIFITPDLIDGFLFCFLYIKDNIMILIVI